MPSRRSTESSARATRIGAWACSGSGSSSSTPRIVAETERLSRRGMAQRVGASNASIAATESSAFGMKPRAELSVTSAPRSLLSRPEVRITSSVRSKPGELLCNLEAVGVWQLHVNDDEIWLVFAGKLDAARARCGPSDDDEAVRLEDLAQSAAERGVVVDDKNPSAHGQILPATASSRSVASPTLSSPNQGKAGR